MQEIEGFSDSLGGRARHKKFQPPRIEKSCLFGGQSALKQASAQRYIPPKQASAQRPPWKQVPAQRHILPGTASECDRHPRCSPPRGAVFPRGHAVFAAEATNEVGKVVKPAQGRNGAYGVRALPQEIGGVAQTIVGKVFAEGEAGLAAEDAHEVRVAVVDQAGGVTDGDGLGEMVLDVEQDLLDGVLVRRGWNAFFLTAMGVNGKEKAE